MNMTLEEIKLINYVDGRLAEVGGLHYVVNVDCWRLIYSNECE